MNKTKKFEIISKIGIVCLVVIVPFLGGILYRIRGGWCSWLFDCTVNKGNVLTHNGILRLIFSLPTGIFVFFLTVHFKNKSQV